MKCRFVRLIPLHERSSNYWYCIFMREHILFIIIKRKGKGAVKHARDRADPVGGLLGSKGRATSVRSQCGLRTIRVNSNCANIWPASNSSHSSPSPGDTWHDREGANLNRRTRDPKSNEGTSREDKQPPINVPSSQGHYCYIGKARLFAGLPRLSIKRGNVKVGNTFATFTVQVPFLLGRISCSSPSIS